MDSLGFFPVVVDTLNAGFEEPVFLLCVSLRIVQSLQGCPETGYFLLIVLRLRWHGLPGVFYALPHLLLLGQDLGVELIKDFLWHSLL